MKAIFFYMLIAFAMLLIGCDGLMDLLDPTDGLDDPDPSTINLAVTAPELEDDARPVSISFAGNRHKLLLGSSMTVTATPSEPVDTFQWYIDGAQVDNAIANTVTVGDGLAEGVYCLYVYAMKGEMVSSDFVEFRVSSTPDLNEGFESGLLPAGWNGDWSIDSESYAGTYSLNAASIGDDQASTVVIDVDIAMDTTLTFFMKVSSEEDFDYLDFYIDSTQPSGATWSGDIDWIQQSYPIQSGPHTLRWTYSKDGSDWDYSDTAWIDLVSIEHGEIIE